MSAPRTFTGDVLSVRHVGGSQYGNPTYRITLTDGSEYVTQTDAGCAYGATNFVPHSLRDPIVTVTLFLSRAGRVTDIKRLNAEGSGDVYGYLSQDERTVENFNGVPILRVTRRSVTRTGFHRSTVTRVWAVSATGGAYYGAGAGGSMSIRMRRVKGGR